MRRTTSRNPSRVGLRPQPCTRSSRPDTSDAAMKNAADETSPGTPISNDGTARAGSTSSAPSATRSPRPSPSPSMRSVWSRESIRPPMRDGPSARSAARTSAPFTWALATGRSQARGRRVPVPGQEAQGQQGAADPALDARAHRAQGSHHAGHRPDREGRVADKGREQREARRACPDSRRVVVPELPASSAAGRFREAAQAGAADRQRPIRRFHDRDPEPLEAPAGRQAVAGGEGPAHDARAVGQGGEEERPVGDRLVGRRRIRASQPRASSVEGRLHGGESSDGV